jgi:hypothetical protein
MTDTKLIAFIKEARRRGFGDYDIRKALVNHNWPEKEIEKGFVFLQPKFESKNQISLFLSDELLDALDKRAKKNMCTVSEQIEDILRRSTISQTKKNPSIDEKLDDTLVSIFSRRRTAKKK